MLQQENQTRISELENALQEEQKKTELLDKDSNKLFETEEVLVKTKEELETVRQELESTKRTTTGKY